MSAPYSVGPGWWPMLDEMSGKVLALDPNAQLMYKEKYGTVQVDYITESVDHVQEINRLTMEAEEASGHICEFCGQPGELREQNRWLTTTCDRCAALNPLERRKVAQDTEERYFRAGLNEFTRDFFKDGRQQCPHCGDRQGLRATYDAMLQLQEDLRFEIQAATTVSEVDYRTIKALAAALELQEYLAHRIAAVVDADEQAPDLDG